MRNILSLLAALLILCGQGVAQPARFLVDKTDPFTKERIMQTNSYWGTQSIVSTNTKIEYYVVFNNDEASLFIRLYRIYNFKGGDTLGYQLMATDSQGNIAVLNGSEEAQIDNERVKTNNVHWGYGIVTGSQKKAIDIILSFPINKNVVENPIIKDIQCIRLTIGEQNYDYNLNKADRKNLIKLTNLVMPYM